MECLIIISTCNCDESNVVYMNILKKHANMYEKSQ